MSRDEKTTDPVTQDARPSLIVVGPGIFARYPLPVKGEISIGRASTADIPVDHASVSRAHAKLRVLPSFAVEDLGSANGTTLNGVPIDPGRRIPIKAGDVIGVGEVAILLRSGPPRAAPASSRSEPIVGSGAMREVFALVDRVAPSEVNVLVLGETGVGKEVVARALHERSPRASRPFSGINCAALVEGLLESELFGHEKGAFTGADRTKPGLLEAANGGVVFLDEVGELPPGTQAKLLRVFEERKLRRIGSVDPVPLDVRFVAATNRDLEADVAAGRFRSDLFFRLAAFVLEVPPLRERVAEVEPLARRFLEAICAQLDRPVPELSREALALLQAHRWPGNVRELQNVVQRAALLAQEGTILPEHLGKLAAAPRSAPPHGLRAETRQNVDAIERQRIVEALEACGGNQTRAAQLLGISRRTLSTKLTRHGLRNQRRS